MERNPQNYKLTTQQERILDVVVENDGCWTNHFWEPGDQAAVATLLALGLVEYELEMGEQPGTVTVATDMSRGFYLLPVMTDEPL